MSKTTSSLTGVRCTGSLLCSLTHKSKPGFISQMRVAVAPRFLMFLAAAVSSQGAREEPKVVEKVTPLPVALDKDFEFRKTKLFFLSEQTPKASQRTHGTSTLGAKSNTPNQKTATVQDAPITFERQYRLYGAVT